MIKIQVGLNSIDDLVDKASPTWRTRAQTATIANLSAGQHVRTRDGLWSEIKAVFVDMQRSKCAYCERKLGSSGIEWDMEHFRPKNRVTAWSSPTRRLIDVGGASRTGYFRLAFNPANYLVSCKTCNTIYKRDYFPTAAPRQLSTDDVAVLRAEQPYLANPADPDDADPEQLIRFVGPIPVPATVHGPERRRALVTIELLNLAREDLIRDRVTVIVGVWTAHQLLNNPHDETRTVAQQTLELLCSDDLPHSNCARCFRNLCVDDPVTARAEVDRALAMLRNGD